MCAGSSKTVVDPTAVKKETTPKPPLFKVRRPEVTEDPEAFFAQLEAQFPSTASSDDKFKAAVSVLTAPFYQTARAIIKNPPYKKRYQALRSLIIKRHTEQEKNF